MPPKVKNYLIIVLLASTGLSGFIAWQQTQRLSALQDELLKATADAAKLKAQSTPAASTFTAATPKKETAGATDPAATEDPAASQSRQRNNNRPNFAALMANPEFAKAMTVQQRAALDTRYAELFKKLNLSPADLEKFKDLLLERQTARMDVMTTARDQGLDPRENRDELRKLTAEAQAEVDASIKTAMGDTVYDQYQSYETTQSERNVVTQIDQRLSYSSTPLTSTQSDFLINALASSSTAAEGTDQPLGGGGGPGNWGGNNNSATITDAVIQQAQSVLTANQVEALKQVQTEQQAQAKVRELMRANGGGGNRQSRN